LPRVSAATAELTRPSFRREASAVPGSPARRLTGGRLYLILAGFALVVAALSLLIPSTPSYDPWAWLVWGREIIHLNLHTTGGPTWKPLPVIFTTIFSLFGSAAPDLWLVVARAGALVAVLMAFKVAWRIAAGLFGVRAEGTGWVSRVSLLPILFAALVAAASLANSRGFVTDNALGYSEGLMTALVLIAFDRHLDGSRRQAFAIGFFAALDRPELWAIWGPYGLYLWWTDPGARKLVGSLFVLIPILWFGPELWGSGHLFRGVTRAQHVRSNSAALAKCPFCTEFRQHAWPKVMFRIKAVALLATAVAGVGLYRTRASWWRRGELPAGTRGRLMLLAAGTFGWLWWILIALLTQAGFSGNDRYLVLGSALISIAGGVGWGWAAVAAASLAARLRRADSRPALWASGLAVVIAAVILIAAPPWIGPSVIDVPATHRALVYQAHLREDMATVVKRLGRRQILGCGTVMTEGFQVPMLAWNLDVHTMQIEAPPTEPGQGTPPNVIFQTRAQSNATLLPIIRPWHVNYSLVARQRTFRVFMNCAAKAA
jgi:hypothetical protein